MRLVAFLLTFVIISCGFENSNSKEDKKRPNDFSFQIDTGGTERYDSNTSTFERDYLEGTKKIKVHLSEKELNLIYDKYLKINFKDFPEKFEKIGEITVVILPSFTSTIVIRTNGKVQKVQFNSEDFENTLKEQNKADAFNEFYDFIWEILRNHPEIKSLKESDIYFM